MRLNLQITSNEQSYNLKLNKKSTLDTESQTKMSIKKITKRRTTKYYQVKCRKISTKRYHVFLSVEVSERGQAITTIIDSKIVHKFKMNKCSCCVECE